MLKDNLKKEDMINEITDVDEIKDEIYKIQKEIIIEELKIDLANDILSIEKNGGDRHSYSKENDKVYNESIEKAVNKLVDDDLSLEDIKGINNEKLEMYEDYFNSFLICKDDLPTSFVENKSFEEMKPHIDNRLLDKIKEVKGEEYFDNMDLKDIRSYEPLAEKGVVSICYEKETDEKGEVYTKSYTDFEEYSENVVNSKKKEIINEEVQSIKKELMGKTDIENNCIKTKDFFELKEKYEKELEKVEDKLENLKGNKEKVVNKEEVQEKVKEEKELEIE